MIKPTSSSLPTLPQLLVPRSRDAYPPFTSSLLGREAIAKVAKDFEVERGVQRAADFVVKDNEPGDVGINGVANGGKALSDFRAKVIRTIVKQTSAKAGGKATFVTITKGKAPYTASKDDQRILSKFT